MSAPHHTFAHILITGGSSGIGEGLALAYAAQGVNTAPIYQYLNEGADDAVEQVRKKGEAMGVPVRTMVKEGRPGEEIIKASGYHDLIVMGTLGRTGVRHLLLGSVAEKVVRHAACPVLVVRIPDGADQQQ